MSPKRGERAAPPAVGEELATGVVKGSAAERWQYEVTGGGRIWYLVDDENRTARIVYAGTGHPNLTD